jgi:hypothetical protein
MAPHQPHCCPPHLRPRSHSRLPAACPPAEASTITRASTPSTVYEDAEEDEEQLDVDQVGAAVLRAAGCGSLYHISDTGCMQICVMCLAIGVAMSSIPCRMCFCSICGATVNCKHTIGT